MCSNTAMYLEIVRHILSQSNSLLSDDMKIKEENEIPRCFDDYKIEVDEKMPEGVELIEKL